MSVYRASYAHVSRKVFNMVCDRLKNDYDEFISHVTIYYSGTNLYGDLTIEGHGGYGEAYKKALQVFNEEYCK